MCLYSWELIHTFGVKNLIRIGTCGALQGHIEMYDIIFAMGACTDSNYINQFGLPGTFSSIASFKLLEKAKKIADEKRQKVHVGNILTGDAFYSVNYEAEKKWLDMGILCGEMETAGLYINAAYAGVNALSILTVIDHILKEEHATTEERETAFTKMMEIALDLA
jgi:purine-nucleoside phosphorylase